MKLIQRSLALKLMFAFLLVSVTGVVLTALFARQATYRAFEALVLDRAREDYVMRAAMYFEAYGSWDGIALALRTPAPSPPPDPRQGQPQTSPVAFALVDTDRVVVASAGPLHLGTRLSRTQVAGGFPVEVAGQTVGTIITTGEPPELYQREQAYLTSINRVSLYAALWATLIALILGAVLASTLTRPIQALTRATKAVAAGDLEQRVDVQTQDELGELATAFNRMSTDLAQANAARRRMTADIAHDLRTPLTVISGYLESLRDGVLQPTQARFETMYAEAQHLLRLVEDLRTLSLADAGELSLNKATVPPRELLERLANVYQHAAEQNGITLFVDVPGHLPNLFVDPDRILQVLGNLVSNALRYTPDGGQITLSAAARGNAIALTVADTGEGIPAEDLPRIFDRFYRVDTSRTSHPSSAAFSSESGLGLAIARSIVEAHDGAISVTSQVGQGTTFTVALPV